MPTINAINSPSAHGQLINIQVFTATGAGTYTPTVGMNTCWGRMVGGGGGSGATTGAGSTKAAAAGGGASGGYLEWYATAANIGASATISIGIAGTAGTTGGSALGLAAIPRSQLMLRLGQQSEEMEQSMPPRPREQILLLEALPNPIQ